MVNIEHQSLVTFASFLVPIVSGLGLILKDIAKEHQQSNLRDGKQFVKEQELKPNIIDLLGSIDEAVDMQNQIHRVWDQLDGDEERPNITEIIDEDDIPYTRTQIDELKESASKISELENNYEDLASHRRKIGIGLIASGLYLGTISALNIDLFPTVWLGGVIVAGFIISEVAAFWKKTQNLEDYAGKFERCADL